MYSPLTLLLETKVAPIVGIIQGIGFGIKGVQWLMGHDEILRTAIERENSVFFDLRETQVGELGSTYTLCDLQIRYALDAFAIQRYVANKLVEMDDLALLPHFKPQRMLYHEVIAQVRLQLQIDSQTELRRIVSDVYEKAKHEIHDIDFRELRNRANVEYNSCRRDPDIMRQYYQLREQASIQLSSWGVDYIPPLRDWLLSKIIERCVNLYSMLRGQFYVRSARAVLKPLVAQIIERDYAEQKIQFYPLQDRLIYCVSGPVASGKSSAKKSIIFQHPDAKFVFIGLDEIGSLLSKEKLERRNPYLHSFVEWVNEKAFGVTTSDKYERSKLPLAEAWLVADRLHELLNEQMRIGNAPHVIMECMKAHTSRYFAAKGGRFRLFVNTGKPEGSVERAQKRGDEEGRYVDPVATLLSYKYVYRHFYLAIKKALSEDYNESDIDIVLHDTDKFHQLKKSLSGETNEVLPTEGFQLATFSRGSGRITIHDLQGLLQCIERQRVMLEQPKHSSRIWQSPPQNLQDSLISLLQPLFFDGAVDVYYLENPVTHGELAEIIRKESYSLNCRMA